MVSLGQRQDLSAIVAGDLRLKRVQLLLDGGDVGTAQAGEPGIHDSLLSAIAIGDAVSFQRIVAEIGKRRIAPDCDWCNDEFLFFLLLLGKHILKCPVPFLATVVELRRANPNRIPRMINEVFASLEREEFGLDGEFSFLKIPFLWLTKELKLGPDEAQKALIAMSNPELFEQFSPFLKLLTQKAFDLVLFERQPIARETVTELIEGIESHAKDVSLYQWWRIVVSLPGRVIWTICAGIVTLGVVPFMFGVGRGVVESHRDTERRLRPAEINVERIFGIGSDLPPETLILARNLPGFVNGDVKKTLSIVLKTIPFHSATPSFVIEVSHPEKSIHAAFVFSQITSGGQKPFTVIPTQRDGGRIRVVLPEQSVGDVLYFVIRVDAAPNENIVDVGKQVILRSLP
jgi:hypothetical protein